MNQSKTLNYGMGLFETMRLQSGILKDLDQHMERLYSSLESLSLSFDLTKEALVSALYDYVKSHDLETSAIKVLVGDFESDYIISHRPVSYKSDAYVKGFRLFNSDIKRHSSNPLLQYKTSNYWLNILVRSGIGPSDEMLFFNEDGAITEGTVTNIFALLEDKIVTPPVSSGLLPGIMRRKVLDYCEALRIPYEEAFIFPEDLLSAKSIFITNSLMGIMPVTEYLGLKKGIDSSVMTLMEVFNEA